MKDKQASMNIFSVLAVLAAALAGVVLMAGCGKKGPPVPPGVVAPPAVAGLSYRFDGDRVVLFWKSPDMENARYSIDTYSIYRSKTPLSDPDCETCPVLFEKAGEVPGNKTSYGENIETGFNYIYKVKAFSDSGLPGSDSESVTFDF